MKNTKTRLIMPALILGGISIFSCISSILSITTAPRLALALPPAYSTPINCKSFPNLSSCVASPQTLNKTLLLDKKYTVKNIHISNRGLTFIDGGVVQIEKNCEVILDGPFNAPVKQVFTGAGHIRFGKKTRIKEVHPAWWGDFPNDNGDDTFALEQAILSLSRAGGQIRISDGIHLIGGVKLQSNIRIVGNGWSSILKIRDGLNWHGLATKEPKLFQNIFVGHLAIDGNKKNNQKGGSGIVVAGKNITVEDVYIHDTAEACLLFGYRAGGGDYRAIGNFCLNPATAGNNWGGIAATGGNNIFFRGNRVKSTEGYMTYGLDIEPNQGTPVGEIGSIIIEGNIIESGRIFVDGGNISAPINNVNISGNQVDARRSKDTGITAPLYLRNVSNVSITNNQCSSHETGKDPVLGVYLDNVHSFSISDNTFYVNDTVNRKNNYGIYFLSGKPSSSGKIFRNLITADGYKSLSFGIYGYSENAVKGLLLDQNTGKNVETLHYVPSR